MTDSKHPCPEDPSAGDEAAAPAALERAGTHPLGTAAGAVSGAIAGAALGSGGGTDAPSSGPGVCATESVAGEEDPGASVGEAPCPRCAGSGQLAGQRCPECAGTGNLVQGIGGA